MKITKKVNQIETEERTALSMILGLKIKFGKERKDPKQYSSIELYNMISNLLSKANKQKIDNLIRDNELESKAIVIEDEIIQKKVRESKIFRANWVDIYGMSLTRRVHILRNSGKSVEETLSLLKNHPNLKELINKSPKLESKYLENLETTVRARYVENKTAEEMKDKNESN